MREYELKRDIKLVCDLIIKYVESSEYKGIKEEAKDIQRLYNNFNKAELEETYKHVMNMKDIAEEHIEEVMNK